MIFQKLISLRYPFFFFFLVWCPGMCSVSVPFVLGMHFFVKKYIQIVRDILHNWQLDQCCLTTAISKTRKPRKFRKIFSKIFKSEFCPTAKIENSEIRKLGIIFSRFPRFPRFPSFRPSRLTALIHYLHIFSSFMAFVQKRDLKREGTNFLANFTAIRVLLIYSRDLSTENARCFPINTFSP